MVIEIPSDSELPDTTFMSNLQIEEEITSPKIQRPQQQLEIVPMVRTWKKHANGASHTTILTPSSCVVPNPARRPPVAPTTTTPIMEPR